MTTCTSLTNPVGSKIKQQHTIISEICIHDRIVFSCHQKTDSCTISSAETSEHSSNNNQNQIYRLFQPDREYAMLCPVPCSREPSPTNVQLTLIPESKKNKLLMCEKRPICIISSIQYRIYIDTMGKRKHYTIKKLYSDSVIPPVLGIAGSYNNNLQPENRAFIETNKTGQKPRPL